MDLNRAAEGQPTGSQPPQAPQLAQQQQQPPPPSSQQPQQSQTLSQTQQSQTIQAQAPNQSNNITIQPQVQTAAPQTTQSQSPIQPLNQIKTPIIASTTTAPMTTTSTTPTTTAQPQQQQQPLQTPATPTPHPCQIVATTMQPQLAMLAPQTTTTATSTATTTMQQQQTQAIQLTTTSNNSQPLPLSTKLPPAAVTTPPNFASQISATTTPNPVAAHQQSITLVQQPTIVNRPPTTLTIVPLTTSTAATIKQEPNKYICCLLDNGVRCDRVAGNASFSARIQKIVGTKKMNFALDPNVRHAYICEHHKAIITVAKKSTAISKEMKSNARNYNNPNNSTNIIPSPAQHNSNFNDPISLSRQPTLQHPVNLELITNQNRLVNNHTGINSIPIRPGAQIAYGHFQGTIQNQVAPMDVMMSTGFDNAGGDRLSGGSSVDVDLQQLQVNTLRRYKRHFRVQTRPGLNKNQLAESLKSHFRTLPIIEKEAITYFVYIVKCYRNKLDHNPKAD